MFGAGEAGYRRVLRSRDWRGSKGWVRHEVRWSVRGRAGQASKGKVGRGQVVRGRRDLALVDGQERSDPVRSGRRGAVEIAWQGSTGQAWLAQAGSGLAGSDGAGQAWRDEHGQAGSGPAARAWAWRRAAGEDCRGLESLCMSCAGPVSSGAAGKARRELLGVARTGLAGRARTAAAWRSLGMARRGLAGLVSSGVSRRALVGTRRRVLERQAWTGGVVLRWAWLGWASRCLEWIGSKGTDHKVRMSRLGWAGSVMFGKVSRGPSWGGRKGTARSVKAACGVERQARKKGKTVINRKLQLQKLVDRFRIDVNGIVLDMMTEALNMSLPRPLPRRGGALLQQELEASLSASAQSRKPRRPRKPAKKTKKASTPGHRAYMKAWRLRKKQRAGKVLTKSQEAWLKRYDERQK